MKLIVGLGNPGEKYQHTRHNLGFDVVEQFLKDFTPVSLTVWKTENKFKSDIAQLEWQSKKNGMQKLLLVKPNTYMNNSGMAVSLLVHYFDIRTEDIWIINDELDLPLGSMKIRFGGASAGHKGVESVIDSLNTDKFWRFRLGIGHTRQKTTLAKQKMNDVDDYVLGNFVRGESGKVRELVKRGAKALQTALEDGIQTAMNRFNTK